MLDISLFLLCLSRRVWDFTRAIEDAKRSAAARAKRQQARELRRLKALANHAAEQRVWDCEDMLSDEEDIREDGVEDGLEDDAKDET